MEKLASSGVTFTCIAEVRAFMNVALFTACTFLAVAVNSEGSTNRSRRRNSDVSVMAALVRAIAPSEMQASRRTLRSEFM